MADICHACRKVRTGLRGGTQRYHPSTRSLAPFLCSALTNLPRKKPGVNYLMCLDSFPDLFETVRILFLRRNALLERYCTHSGFQTGESAILFELCCLFKSLVVIFFFPREKAIFLLP